VSPTPSPESIPATPSEPTATATAGFVPETVTSGPDTSNVEITNDDSPDGEEGEDNADRGDSPGEEVDPETT
jgi:hypothetical protein